MAERASRPEICCMNSSSLLQMLLSFIKPSALIDVFQFIVEKAQQTNCSYGHSSGEFFRIQSSSPPPTLMESKVS